MFLFLALLSVMTPSVDAAPHTRVVRISPPYVYRVWIDGHFSHHNIWIPGHWRRVPVRADCFLIIEGRNEKIVCTNR
jgi:hypothetical protein